MATPTSIACAAPNCNVVIEEPSEAIAIARFNSHMLHHTMGQVSARTPALHKTPKMERPGISSDSSEETWMNFLRRWDLFKKCTVMDAAETSGQLFLCCDEELGNYILKTEPTALDGSEQQLLQAIKRLAVIPVAISVRRAELIQMQQSHGENIRSFYAKVKGKAATCNYNILCSCNPATNVDFTKVIIRDVVIAGLADVDIRKEILGLPDLDRKDVPDIIAIIEGKEMARNALMGGASASGVSTFKKQRNKPSSQQPAQNQKTATATCPGCSSEFHLFTEGVRGWNTKPHRTCIVCWKKQRLRPKPKKSEETGEGAKSNEANALLLQLSATDSSPRITTALSSQLSASTQIHARLDHHIFSDKSWRTARNLTHPKVQLRLTTRKEDYDTFGVEFPKIAPMYLSVITDSGAQSCLWSRSGFDKSGLRECDLIPVTYGMTAANTSEFRIDGAIILRLTGRDRQDNELECAAMVYISPDAHEFYLSREAMEQLGIISKSFPLVGEALCSNISSCDISFRDKQLSNSSDTCTKCPNRQPTPGLPKALPFSCCPENNERMKEWILQRYAASTFNTCHNQILPGMDGPPIRIHVQPDAKPVAAYTPATIPIHWQEQVEKDLLRDEALGVIERVPHGESTPWCHRMVITRKQDGGPRRTVDLSPLNKYCSRETHSMKSPFQLARSVPAQSWKTVTDAWNGYHSVPIHEDDRHLTTFITPSGRWRYIRAPQGFLSSGDGYNRRFDEILADFPRKQRCVDDTLHYDQDLAAHWWRTLEFLEVVGRAGIVLNPTKFQFAQQTVDFAGFRISAQGVEPLPKYLAAIKNFPTPTSITDIRSWFGLVNQVAHYAQLRDLMLPFQPLLSPKSTFLWTDTLDTAFQQSKARIIEAIKTGVEIFDIKRRTCLRTDWSKTGIGYYLSQKHCDCPVQSPGCCNNGWRVTLAGSRFLNKTEQRYAPVEGEMLSVAWGLEQTRYFTQGCDNLLIVTDHKPLLKLLGDRTLDEIANTRLFRLKQRTLMWRFEVEHQPGKDNYVADATSRYPSGMLMDASIETQDENSEESLLICGVQSDIKDLRAVTWQQVKLQTEKDKSMALLTSMIEQGFPNTKQDVPSALSPYWEYRDSLFIHDGVIMYRDRAVIPPALQNDILSALHSAHQGVTAMTARAQVTVFWPGITSDIQKTRDQCTSCNRNAPSHARIPPTAPNIPGTPFESVFADFFDFHGWHFLVLGDRLSGWTTVYRIKSGTQSSGACGLILCLRQLFVTFGVPDELSSDGGPEFVARETQDFLIRWGIHHRVSSAYHPQSNGRAELAVKATKRLLEGNVGPDGSLNTDAFVRAMLTLRNTPDPDCKLSPAQIIFGRPLKDSMPALMGTQKFNDNAVSPMWREAWAAKEDALRTRYARSYETLQEHSRSLPPLRHGDRVFVQNQIGNHPTKWDKSGTVVECRDHDQYIIKVDGSGRLTLRNRRFLRRFEPYSTQVATPVSMPIIHAIPVQPAISVPKQTEGNIPNGLAQNPETSGPPAETPQTDPVVLAPQEDFQNPAPKSPGPRRSTRARKKPKVYDPSTGTYYDSD